MQLHIIKISLKLGILTKDSDNNAFNDLFSSASFFDSFDAAA